MLKPCVLVLCVLPLLVCLAAAGPLLFVGDASTFSLNTYDGTTGVPVAQDIAAGLLGFPKGVAIGPDGNVYLADNGSGAVYRFDGGTGGFLGTFILPGSGLIMPSAMTFSGGDLYIADYGVGGNSFINRYDGSTGAFVKQVVAPGVGPNGGLDDPNGITFGPNGLYVSDGLTGVSVFDPGTGAFLSVFVPIGLGPGAPAGLSNPSGLRFGPDGNLYVVDTTNNVVDRFNGANGTFIDVFGDTGLLSQPIDLTFGPDGNLYVTDSSGVQRFDGKTGATMGAFVTNPDITNAQFLAFTPVPEPSTVPLMVLGALILFAADWSRRRV